MSNPSVSQIRLPALDGFGLRRNFAKPMLLRVLGKLAHGSLTVHDGMESYSFGSTDDSAPNAEENSIEIVEHVVSCSRKSKIMKLGVVELHEECIKSVSKR